MTSVISYRNTKTDFWASLDAGRNAIVCPCCGTHMSLQISASYQLMLTREASVHLNQQLEFYRRTILAVERVLRRHNSTAFVDPVKGSPFPLEERLVSFKGEFSNPNGTAMRGLLSKLDIEKLDAIVQKWPRLREMEGTSDKSAERSKRMTSQDLLQLVQMPTLTAGLNVIVFDQPSTEDVLARFKPVDILHEIRQQSPGKEPIPVNSVAQYLLAHFPCIMRYCSYLARTDQPVEDECLIRLLSILLVYFAHQATGTREFTFGTHIQLRNWHTVAELLTSYHYVSALQDVFPKYVGHIEALTSSAQDASGDDDILKLGSFDNVAKFQSWKDKVPEFEKVVLYTLDFACSGPMTAIPEDAEIVVRRDNKKETIKISEEIAGMVESRACGWIPKGGN